ncbi:hypothetical protein GALMADRAFT_139817 [Galerina marginata CBS 339.88]|uniref:Ribonuclease H1 N-terminal domain-containing protein n=1 Tax=Galerina marginata (strain CBS 339.88) TaxID=685588 RepID=A0A067SYW2_GALM3|nr:hypothetical protein GALMADRAFT_139817 [Galerina marginata CBS 339.88]
MSPLNPFISASSSPSHLPAARTAQSAVVLTKNALSQPIGARTVPKFPSAISLQESLHKKKYYVVVVGKCTGVYYNIWENVECLVSQVPGANHKSFSTYSTAEKYYLDAKKCLPIIKTVDRYTQTYRQLPHLYDKNGSHQSLSDLQEVLRLLNQPAQRQPMPEPQGTVVLDTCNLQALLCHLGHPNIQQSHPETRGDIFLDGRDPVSEDQDLASMFSGLSTSAL